MEDKQKKRKYVLYIDSWGIASFRVWVCFGVKAWDKDIFVKEAMWVDAKGEKVMLEELKKLGPVQ